MQQAGECGTSEIIKIPRSPFQKTAFIKAESGGSSMHVRMKVDFGHTSDSVSHFHKAHYDTIRDFLHGYSWALFDHTETDL